MTIARTHLNELTKFIVYNDAATPVATDISSQVSSVTLNLEYDEKDITTNGNTWKRMKRGLGGGTIEVELYVDFDVAGINTIFSDFFFNQEYVDFEIEDGSLVGYTGRFLMSKWIPFSGATGDFNQTSLSFPLDGAVTAL